MPTPDACATLPTLVAHRGNAAEFPENTLPALESAVALGLRHVEFDVQLTADRVPVLLHDADLARVGGRPDRVFDLEWSRLERIPVGESARLGPAFAGIGAPSLEQVVHWLRSRPEVTAFVEVKRASLRHFGAAPVVGRIVDALQPVAGQCVIISFDLPCLLAARAASGTRIGWVISRYDEPGRLEALQAAPDVLFCDQQRLPADGSRLWDGPWQWAVYELSSVDEALAMSARGVGYAETMAVRAMLAQYAEAGFAG